MIPFWRTPDFAAFVPYLRATPAYDKRMGAHARIELRYPVPRSLERTALDFIGGCAACGSPIRVFRQRQHGGTYLAVSCPLTPGSGCTKGRAAAAAYDAIERLIQDGNNPDVQLPLLPEAPPPVSLETGLADKSEEEVSLAGDTNEAIRG